MGRGSGPRRSGDLAAKREGGYGPRMSTLAEIEAAVDRLPRREQEILRAHLEARLEASPEPAAVRLAAFEALQARLALDADGSREWMVAVREARR